MDASRFQSGGADGPPDSENSPSPSAAFREALDGVKEIKEYAAQFMAAKVDRWALTVRKAVFFAVLGMLALLVGMVVVIVSTSLLLIGLSEAVAAMLGGRAWAGDLIVGGGVLLLLAVGSWLGLRMYFGASRRKTVERYEQRLKHQRQSCGHDARQRSFAGTAE